MSQPEVQHYPDQNKFVIELEGDNAVLEYLMLDAQSLDFTSTYVPFRQRGRGYAEALVEAGLSWARAQNFSIQASCWYVDKFLK